MLTLIPEVVYIIRYCLDDINVVLGLNKFIGC